MSCTPGRCARRFSTASVSAVCACVCVASSAAAAAGVHTWMHSGVNEEIRVRSSMLRSEISFTIPRAWSAPHDSDISILCYAISSVGLFRKEKL